MEWQGSQQWCDTKPERCCSGNKEGAAVIRLEYEPNSWQESPCLGQGIEQVVAIERAPFPNLD